MTQPRQKTSSSLLTTLLKVNIFFLILFLTVLYIFVQLHETQFDTFYQSVKMRRGEVSECVKHFQDHPHVKEDKSRGGTHATSKLHQWLDLYKCDILSFAVPSYQLSCDLGILPKKYDHCLEFQQVSKRLSLKNLIRFQEWGESVSTIWKSLSQMAWMHTLRSYL
uniref:Uncharacterized protein n=1 Tax=Percolomonas cosmopolitus TaxID=63605 RepID=A0A7S1KRT8_9EUKA|mmetsp:Transcript_6244/g.23491  ORF Transcript_6244/g.23491 Transcript_6244/m.23491 type:complete len:165 (+) Transcript_6244:1-495(+)